MAKYTEAVFKSSGELVTIGEFLQRSPRPPLRSLVCPACDGFLNGRDHPTDPHFYHLDILDSQCPEAHYIHWKAINALYQTLQSLDVGSNLTIKVEKHFMCDCPVHQEESLDVPCEWSEPRIENLQGHFFSPRLEPDPERRWAPRLWIRVGNKEVRFEVSAGKSIAERAGVPTLEFICSTEEEVALIEQGRLELLSTRRFHWPPKVEREQCGGMELPVWYGVLHASGKPYVEPKMRKYSDYLKFKQRMEQQFGKPKCIPRDQARSCWEAQDIMFPGTRKVINTGDEVIINWD